MVIMDAKHSAIMQASPSVSDCIESIKMGLSQSLLVKEGTLNLNVTLNGYPQKFWGLLDKVAHKT